MAYEKKPVHLIEIDGILKTRPEWCKEYGITTSAVTRRMQRHGMTLTEAITYSNVTKVQLKEDEFYSRSRPDVHMRQIPEIRDCYATIDGRIWNDKRRVIVGEDCYVDPAGYSRISVNGHEAMYLHRLICSAWHDNPDDKRCVDHIDRDKSNNHKDNLRWATYSENSRNRSDNILLDVDGESVVAIAVLQEIGLEALEISRVCKRLREGHTLETALERGVPGIAGKAVTVYGRTQTLQEWTDEAKCHRTSLKHRVVNKGETHEEAILHFLQKAGITE